jgi:hypothetical protein
VKCPAAASGARQIGFARGRPDRTIEIKNDERWATADENQNKRRHGKICDSLPILRDRIELRNQHLVTSLQYDKL